MGTGYLGRSGEIGIAFNAGFSHGIYSIAGRRDSDFNTMKPDLGEPNGEQGCVDIVTQQLTDGS